ncbi:fad dependent oxidoreductase [Leptolyngbya sp. Heron Island J]|uniref:FAD-dependent oxidoreductase n=1 Tax=Leptolyngbya sp. Heron Island J TaxID=1385935 RepID=UPI0003B9543A|nr:FAD-dependent oxidoreductase [Leptolyngbya sp. Heron Island J]ESA38374.1 fad dependent oxidoreductase [Leptolyngbya sp. Heron Island J]
MRISVSVVWNSLSRHWLSAIGLALVVASPVAAAPSRIDQTERCDVLVVGGGLAGVATAYESLRSGRTVCLTEMTDWLGGQLTSQGTTALDEARRQRQLLFYAAGYQELRQRVLEHYGRQNPGDCWVSAVCFLPADANDILVDMLDEAARDGNGTLKWFPSTVVKQVDVEGAMIVDAIAIQHSPAPGTPPLNTETLSAYYEDAYRYEDSERLRKKIIRFQPSGHEGPVDWYVVEATETGEIIALSGVPYRLGLDPKSYLNPSSPTFTGDAYCTQGFTYTFAMERTATPQDQVRPDYYDIYAPYFSFERPRENTNYIDFVFTYRRLLAPGDRPERRIFGVSDIKPGDISMQNWTWGNDYRPGTSVDNLIYSHEQLEAAGQLDPGGWLGGLRVDTLRRGEENAFSYYYWLVAGLTDSQLGYGVKSVDVRHRFLEGFDAPMNTAHGLSKYPYIREGRRIVGRPAFGHPDGFMINEIDISRVDYNDEYYQTQLPDSMYLSLRRALAGLETTAAIETEQAAAEIPRRTRSTIFPDSVGIAQYAIDFHPCMELAPPELPGNTERAGVRRAHGQSYPGQIPLRSLIPQNIDNLLVAGKSIATSTIAAAAYRVHSFEWSAGIAAGATIDYALDNQLLPYTLVDDLPRLKPELLELQQRLQTSGNPTAFPNTSIFNLDWEDWRVW